MIMKKILMLMAIMAAVISLSSCNSFENKAKNSLENEVEDSLGKMPDSLFILHKAEETLYEQNDSNNIINKKIIFLNDSMCTISFVYKCYDDSNLGRCLGRYSQLKFEYTLVKLRKDPIIETTIYSSIFLDVDYGSGSEKSIQKTIDYINNGFPHDLLEDVLEGDVFKLLKKTYNDNIKKGMSKEDAKANCLYIRAIANSDTNGKEITL